MSHFYTQDMIDYIEESFGTLTKQEISDGLLARFRVEKSVSAIESILNRLKLKKGRVSKEKQPKVYTPEIVEFVKEKYNKITIRELTELVNKEFNKDFTYKNMRSMVGHAGIRSGLRSGYKRVFKKSVVMRPNKTSFKKGNKPHNKQRVGYERVDKRGYVQVKVANPNVFKLKHRLIYEKAHGTIPGGCEIIFKDGNRQNFDLSNLVMLTRSEKAILQKHKYLSMPNEFVDTLVLLSKLQAKLLMVNNENNGKQNETK